MRTKKVYVWLGVLAALIVAFGWLDFHVAGSRSDTEHELATARGGEGLPYAMQPQALALAVHGEGRLARALQAAVARELQARHLDVALVDPSTEQSDRPMLRLEVQPGHTLWTPVYGTARQIVKVVFTSNGDLSHLDDQTVVISSADGPVLNLSGEYRLNDRSIGLLSRPGYHTLLAQQVAPLIAEAVAEAYREPIKALADPAAK